MKWMYVNNQDALMTCDSSLQEICGNLSAAVVLKIDGSLAKERLRITTFKLRFDFHGSHELDFRGNHRWITNLLSDHVNMMNICTIPPCMGCLKRS